MNFISIISIFSLVFEYIIFIIFNPFLLSDFIESQLLVKVNALTLTFDISKKNQFLNS